jgi:MscS family membrane protein
MCTQSEWTIFFTIILLSGLAGAVLRSLLSRLAEKPHMRSRPGLAALLKSGARPLPLLALTTGMVIGVRGLPLSEARTAMAQDLCAVLITVTIACFLYRLSDVLGGTFKPFHHSESRMDDMLLPLLRKTVRITIVLLALVQTAQILSNKPITSILAGLGVGGLAVALAAQETIKNFFGSLVIYGDKPFELGERIKVPVADGMVEAVGMRSTRIRTLEGHLVVIPNGELANMPIENIARRPHIRRLMHISIPYDTSPEKVEEALQIVKELLHDHEGMHPDFPPRVFFEDYAACSLDLLVLYWYHPADYWAFRSFSEKFNLELLKRFNHAGIEFAFPTQTLHLNGKLSST